MAKNKINKATQLQVNNQQEEYAQEFAYQSSLEENNKAKKKKTSKTK